jgi:F0F1-type ATP synthase membrane subunit b/b'
MSAAEHKLETEVERVLEARQHLEEALAQAGTRIDQSGAEGDAAIDRLEEDARHVGERLEAAVQAVSDQFAHLKDFLDATRASLTEASNTLVTRLNLAAQNLEGEAAHILEDLAEKSREHVEQARARFEGVGEHVVVSLNEVAESGQRTLIAPIGEATLDLRTAIERVSASAEKHEESLRQHNQGFTQAFAQVEEEAAQIPEAIRKIDAVAQELRHR